MMMIMHRRSSTKNSTRSASSSMIAVKVIIRHNGLLCLFLSLAVILAFSSSSSTSSSSSSSIMLFAEAASSDTEQIFAIQYSSTSMTTSSSSCSGNAVSFMGLLPDTTYDVKIFNTVDDSEVGDNDGNDNDGDNNTTSSASASVTKGNIDSIDNTDNTDNSMLLSCAEQSICLIDSESELCIDINPTGDDNIFTDGPMYVNDTTNNVYWIDESNGNNEFIYNSTSPDNGCIDSIWYPSCHYNKIPLSVLKQNPEQYLSNNNPDDLKQMIPFYYIAYYKDNACTDLTGIISGISGEDTVNILSMDDSFTCSEATICAVDSNSTACKNIVGGPTNTAEVVVVTANIIVNDDGTIQEYDPSNVNTGEDINLTHTQTGSALLSSCGKSSVLANCYYQEFSGITLAQNPMYLIGQFNNTDTTDTTESINEEEENNDHGIDGHNHASDHSNPYMDETEVLLPTTMDDSSSAAGAITTGSVLVLVLAAIIITASSALWGY